MNSLPGKIIIGLLAVLSGINFISHVADAAIDNCANQSCVHCKGAMTVLNKLPQIHGSAASRTCHSSFPDLPCNLKKKPDSKARVFIVPSKKQDRHTTQGSFVFYKTFFLQYTGEIRKADKFLITTGTIPIYLQNLSILR